MILEKTIIFITILISYFMQTSVDFFRLGSINPDFLLILTVYFAYHRGSFAGLWVGFIGGILQDINLGGMANISAETITFFIGTHALPKALIGYFIGKITKSIHQEGNLILFVLVLASSLFKGFLIFFIIAVFHTGISAQSVITIIIPESFYTAIIALIWFRILAWVLPISDVKERI